MVPLRMAFQDRGHRRFGELHVDADILEHLLGQFGHGASRLVAGDRGAGEREPHAVLFADAVAALDPAGLVQQRLGALRIERVCLISALW